MKRIFYTAAIIALMILTVSQTSAQDSIVSAKTYFQDDLLENLIGRWEARGSIGDEKVAYDISAQWSLGHQFMEICLVDTSDEPQYSAKVFIGFNSDSNRYIMHYLDSFGGRFSQTLGYGARKADSIEFRFEYPEGPFINKFIYDQKAGNWKFHSTSQNRLGNWTTFGDIDLQKVKLKISDGFYIVRRIGVDASEFNTLETGVTAINFNNEFLDNAPGGVSLLAIDTTDFVPLELSGQPETQQQTAEKKLLLLSLSSNSTEKLKDFTSKNIMKRVVIVVDGEAYTVHKIREAITGGKIQITRCTDNACEKLYIQLKDNVEKK